MDFSVQLLPDQPLAELIEVIHAADELGFRACYSADETYHKDMWILFAAAAPGTSRIRFGPEVSGVILKDPTLIAQQAATLDELTGGRAEIVFSIGNFALLAQYGIEWQGTKPLARLREAHEVMRRFLADGSIDFEGDYYRYSGLFTAARAVQRPFPLKMGAMKGPGSFRVAGGIADGLHVACAHSREALAFAADNVREGAARAGRSLDDGFDLCASVLGAISEDSAAAKEAARIAAAFYLSSMSPDLVERHGIEYGEVKPIVEAFVRGEVERALDLTTAEVGERLSIAGTPEEWVERIRADVVPEGYGHMALGLVDPSLIESWSGTRLEGLPDLRGQLELFADAGGSGTEGRVMGLEIERKFLVDRVPADLAIDSEDEIAQGYLSVGEDQVRLRRRGDRHVLTVKRGAGLEREEVEVPLAKESFEELWPLTEGRRLEKTRRTTAAAAGTIEIDTYHGPLDGLVTAEIEFADADAARAFQPSPWFVRELTGDESYSNERLATEGLPAKEG